MISYLISSIKRHYAVARVLGTQLIQIFTLLALTFFANAAELGELRIFSTLGEPLRAEIDLANMEDISEAELEVSMAPEEAFEQSGALIESYLSDIRFSVVSARDSSKVIRILSDQPIEDPFLNFIKAIGAEVDKSGRGMGIRSNRYTMFVDNMKIIKLQEEADTGSCEISAAENFFKLI